MERFQRTAQAGSAAMAHSRAEGRSPLSDVTRPDTRWSEVGREPPAAFSVDALRAEVEELRLRLSHAAPRRAVVEMDRAITLLHGRVEDLRIGGLDGPHHDAGQLADELSAVRASLDEMRAPERFEALSAGLDLLARKIDIVNAKAVDPVEMARLQAQSSELKSLVTRALSGSSLQPLAERLAACAEQITSASGETARWVAEATQLLERNAEALLTRVDAFEARTREGQDASADALRRDVEANVRTLHDRLDAVSAQITALSPGLGGALVERLSFLLERIEGAQGAERALLNPLTEVVEHHLVALTERFQHTQLHLERLDGIEDALARMMDELRGMRQASMEATQGAVEEAVEAVTRKVSVHDDGPAVVGLKRGLAALEARQAEVERRANALMGDPLGGMSGEAPVVLGRTADDVWAPRAADPAPDFSAPADHGYTPAMEEAAVAGSETAAAAHPADSWSEARLDDWADARIDPVMEPRERVRPAPRPAAAPEPVAESFADAADEGVAAQPREAFATYRVRKGRRVERSGRERKEMKAETAAHAGSRKAPLKRHLSPALIAAAGAAVLLTASAAAAWTQRDAIYQRANATISRLKAAEAPAVMLAAGGSTSTAALPAPTGPQPLRTAALDGNLAAAYEVGVRLADGVGAAPDVEAGIKWLGYAVSRGYAPAAYRLGSLYENSLQNMDEAYRFYKWAAEQGNVRAMHNLAVLYSQGVDGAPDWGRAIEWFRKAANLGLKDSQHNLGIIFARGLSGTSDLTEALTWFEIAAHQGDQDSADKRDALLKQADAAVQAKARQAAAAFAPQPQKDAANQVAVLPEWNASEAGEHMASAAALFSKNRIAAKQ